MAKMKEHSNTLARDARNLAEATVRLVTATRDLMDPAVPPTKASVQGAMYALDDAEGEAKNILAKTVGA